MKGSMEAIKKGKDEVATVIERLEAVKMSNSEMEEELRRLKVQMIRRIGDNLLTGEIIVTIWELSETNNLGGKIPEEINGCQELEYYAASNNKLEGEISSSIGQLQSLKILNLANNTLPGSIPELSKLSGNTFTGEFPKKLCSGNGKAVENAGNHRPKMMKTNKKVRR
ncbi:hypothetical protein L2E82_31968 [Cichorium intybus]|uniref:Uncharacterized protein n=1 Tax=Cichorium intybus TaxID=13427 RepID=A0ACB9BGB5_CICIN|nr:hypothetical protein L2E82_31968 [Cichorium intybus]